ncbi:MAG: UDP-N-acetylmuramate--L-alanine ligase [Bacteroidales bacterium]|nr:UDP-N-acetylmuramate--L-alanine ligase [Bacteroidales bacterium]
MNIYMLGIGGIGMSALARFFNMRGDHVAGYDRTPSQLTRQLEAEGIAVHYDDNPEKIPHKVDLVVYTPAVPSSNLEFEAIKKRGIELKKRSQVLGVLTQDKRCIAVAGSHGKTTTSSMIAHLLHHSGVGCSAFLGGISKNIDSNLLVNNNSPWVVVEADEYDRSFLQLHPHFAVITATDPDHLDIYGTHRNMLEAYAQFANQTVDEGHLWIKRGAFIVDGKPFISDSKTDSSTDVLNFVQASHSSYSMLDTADDCHAENIRAQKGALVFNLVTPQCIIKNIEMHSAPMVNVENAVVAASVALACGLTPEQVRNGLETFAGVKRRFDCRFRSTDVVYIDDYAHHPNEIESLIGSVRTLFPDRKVTGVFQPHLYSRTRDFAQQFAAALSRLDTLVLMPIYPARELPISGVSSEALLDMVSLSDKHLCTPDEVLQYIDHNRPDVLLTIGAGDIDRLVPHIEQLVKGGQG